MLIISHRANLNGPDPALENTVKAINFCLAKNIQVEIDVWYHHSGLFLGHDEPKYPIDIDYLKENYSMLWIHCKNFEALNYFIDHKEINFFWHESDKFTLTSKNFIWTYPDQVVAEKSIIVCQSLEQTEKYFTADCWGVCTDYVNQFLD